MLKLYRSQDALEAIHLMEILRQQKSWPSGKRDATIELPAMLERHRQSSWASIAKNFGYPDCEEDVLYP